MQLALFQQSALRDIRTFCVEIARHLSYLLVDLGITD